MGWSSSYIDLLTSPPIGTIHLSRLPTFAMMFGDDPTDHPSPKRLLKKGLSISSLVRSLLVGEPPNDQML